jgi:ABC-type Mn2+/Zn2+ transport system ATPase subunit
LGLVCFGSRALFGFACSALAVFFLFLFARRQTPKLTPSSSSPPPPLPQNQPTTKKQPTNHLDLRAVLWLEEYLTRWKKTLVVVSHDRDFLNSVTTDVIHLHDNALHFYRGNFAQFEEMYEQKRREVNKAFDKYEKQLKAAKSSGKSSKQAADKVQGKGKKGGGDKGGGGGGGGGMAESSRDGGPNATPQRWSDYTVSFSFPEPTELPPPLMQLVDAGFSYPGREDFGLEGLNIGVDMGSRVAIVGPNGAGKTTLMNLLSGDLVPNVGESRRSHKLRIGRYAQHFVDALEMDVNPVEYLLHKYPESGLRPEQMRAMLGRFGLSGAHHLTPIVKLSGGQKARVVFASIALSRPHILLLDEVRILFVSFVFVVVFAACEPGAGAAFFSFFFSRGGDDGANNKKQLTCLSPSPRKNTNQHQHYATKQTAHQPPGHAVDRRAVRRARGFPGRRDRHLARRPIVEQVVRGRGAGGGECLVSVCLLVFRNFL